MLTDFAAFAGVVEYPFLLSPMLLRRIRIFPNMADRDMPVRISVGILKRYGRVRVAIEIP